jgi:ParB-like nuclease domain
VECGYLVKSILTNGLRDPIVIFEGRILDGRNRYEACLEAKVDPKFQQFTGKDPFAFVVDHNLHLEF